MSKNTYVALEARAFRAIEFLFLIKGGIYAPSTTDNPWRIVFPDHRPPEEREQMTLNGVDMPMEFCVVEGTTLLEVVDAFLQLVSPPSK